jgi:hypothetical protein
MCFVVELIVIFVVECATYVFCCRVGYVCVLLWS